MRFKHTLLVPGNCPFCDKNIYIRYKNDKPVKENENHAFLWCRFNDGTDGNFSCCKDCLNIVTDEQKDKLFHDQVYTWGMEVIDTPIGLISFAKQLMWYVNTAVHLRPVKWANSKEGLS